MAYYTVLANLNIIANLLGTNNTVLINVNIVAYNHFCVSEATLLFDVARSDNTLLANNSVDAHGNLCKISPKNRTGLNNSFSVNENLF